MNAFDNQGIDVRSVLEQNKLFAQLAFSDDAPWFQGAEIRHYNKGDIVYQRDDRIDCLFVIIQGAIRFDIHTSNGEASFMEIAAGGQYFGELEMFLGQPARSSAVAWVNTQLLLLPREPMLQLFDNSADFARGLALQTMRNLRAYQTLVVERAKGDLEQRLAKLLLGLMHRWGVMNNAGNPVIKVSHDEMAGMLDYSRQRVTKQLNVWEKLGLLELGYGEITFLNSDGLEAVIAG